MKLVGLTAYGIEIRNEEHNNFELHNIYGVPLLDHFYGIANAAIDEYNRDRATENIFAYNAVDFQTVRNDAGQDAYQILYLRIKTGDYGEESEIVDSETGEITHNKSVEEADVLPF